MTAPSLAERALREQIMHVLAERAVRNGGVVSRDELSAMRVGDRKLRLIDQSRGIWNPSWLDATLSIVSSPDGPYNDTELEGGLLRYDYRAGTAQGDNRKLRAALELGVPLILLRKIETGVYVPVFPVYVVDDDQANHQFVVALDESLRFLSDPIHPTDDERRYADRQKAPARDDQRGGVEELQRRCADDRQRQRGADVPEQRALVRQRRAVDRKMIAQGQLVVAGSDRGFVFHRWPPLRAGLHADAAVAGAARNPSKPRGGIVSQKPGARSSFASPAFQADGW